MHYFLESRLNNQNLANRLIFVTFSPTFPYSLTYSPNHLMIILTWYWLVITRCCWLLRSASSHEVCSTPSAEYLWTWHLPLLARLSGTLPEDMHWLKTIACLVRFLRTVTGSHWRRFYFRTPQCVQRIRGFLTRMCYINPHLTLTYLKQYIIGECYVQSSIEFWVLKLEFRALTE